MTLTRIGNGPGRPRIQQEITVLKKAGIVVATAAAGLLALSPLAFAGESHKDWHKEDRGSATSVQNTEGLVNVTDTNVNPALNVCDNQIPVNVLGVQVPINDTDALNGLTGALGIPVGSEDSGVTADGDTTMSDDCIANTSTDATNG
jgi:hypothetical protein